MIAYTDGDLTVFEAESMTDVRLLANTEAYKRGLLEGTMPPCKVVRVPVLPDAVPAWAWPTAAADAQLQADIAATRPAGAWPKTVDAIAAWRDARLQADIKATRPRDISDPFPDPGTPPHYRPTPQLRWLESQRGKSMTLQQLWVTDDGKEESWRPVPTVKGAR